MCVSAYLEAANANELRECLEMTEEEEAGKLGETRFERSRLLASLRSCANKECLRGYGKLLALN